MDQSYYDGFKKNWDKFITRLQGQMIKQANNGVLTLQSANLILSECIGFWDSNHSEGGRWLNELEKEYPEKAEMVRDIILNDMKFESSMNEETNQDYLKYVIPVGSGVAGFLVSKLFTTNPMIQTICTIAPAIVSYPITNNVLHSIDDSNKKEMIKNQIIQLNRYKVSIESIVLDM